MKKTLFMAIAASLCFWACSDENSDSWVLPDEDSSNSNSEGDSPEEASTYESEDDMPSCTNTRKGELALVGKDYFVCIPKKWKNIDEVVKSLCDVPSCDEDSEDAIYYVSSEKMIYQCVDGSWEDSEGEGIDTKTLFNCLLEEVIQDTVETEEDLPSCSTKRNGKLIQVGDETFTCNESQWSPLNDVVLSTDELAECDDSREGDIVYIIEKKISYTCDGEVWSNGDDVIGTKTTDKEDENGEESSSSEEESSSNDGDSSSSVISPNSSSAKVSSSSVAESSSSTTESSSSSVASSSSTVFPNSSSAKVSSSSVAESSSSATGSSSSIAASSSSTISPSSSSARVSSSSVASSSSKAQSSSSTKVSSSSTIASSSSINVPYSSASVDVITGTCQTEAASIMKYGSTTWRFTNTGRITPSSYLWVFTNGNKSVSTAASPSVTYNTVGTGTASLVLDEGLDTEVAISCENLTIKSPDITGCTCKQPVADGTTDLADNNPAVISWTVSGCSSEGSEPLSYSWTGATGTTNTGTASFTKKGDFAPSVTITNTDGNSKTISCPAVTISDRNNPYIEVALSTSYVSFLPGGDYSITINSDLPYFSCMVTASSQERKLIGTFNGENIYLEPWQNQTAKIKSPGQGRVVLFRVDEHISDNLTCAIAYY